MKLEGNKGFETCAGRKKGTGAAFALFLLINAGGFMVIGAGMAYGWPWSKDMFRQPSVKPQEGPRMAPSESIPRKRQEPPMDRVEAGKKLHNPLKATAASIENGKRLFEIYCAPCHGVDAKGSGPVAGKFVPPPDLTLEVFRKRPDGFIYETIKDGGPIMPPQGEALSSEERWEIVNYLRVLQRQ